MRALAVGLGIAVGLALAAAAAGRMAHLRLAEAVPLPAWTLGVTDESGLANGLWRGPVPNWPVTGFGWDLRGISAQGVVYRAEIETPGGDLDPELRLPAWPNRAEIVVADQILDLSRLIAGAEAAGLSGFLAVARLAAEIAVPGGAVNALDGTGEIRGLTLLGSAFDPVPVRLETTDAGGWRAVLRPVGPLTGEVTVTGGFGGTTLRIAGTLREAEPIPSALRSYLAGVALLDGAGWSLEIEVERAALLAAP